MKNLKSIKNWIDRINHNKSKEKKMSSNAVKMIRSDRKITGLDISKRLSSNLDPQLNDLNFNLLYLYTVDPRNNKSSFHLKVFRKKRKLKQKETSRTFCCERKTLNRMESSSNRLLSSFSSKSLCLYLLMILSGLNCFNVDANRRHWTSYNSETQHSLRHHRGTYHLFFSMLYHSTYHFWTVPFSLESKDICFWLLFSVCNHFRSIWFCAFEWCYIIPQTKKNLQSNKSNRLQ